MKKIMILFFVFVFIFTFNPNNLNAFSFNDLTKQINSLQKYFNGLGSQVSALVLRSISPTTSVSTTKNIPTPVPVVQTSTPTAEKSITPLVVKEPVASLKDLNTEVISPSCDLNNVKSVPWVKILSPNGGEVFEAGQKIPIKFESCNLKNKIAKIELVIPSSGSSFTLAPASAISSNYEIQERFLPTDFEWPNIIYGKNFKIKISTINSLGNLISDMSDNLFTIDGIKAHCYADWNNGKDINAGTNLLPKKHIQACINLVSNGQIVIAKPGKYIENIDFTGKNITVASNFLNTNNLNDIDNTIIDGNANGSVVTFKNGENNNAILIGFTIQNGKAENGGGIFIRGGATSYGAGPIFSTTPKLSNLKIKSNLSTAYSAGGSSALGGGGISIFNNGLAPSFPYFNTVPVLMENLEISDNITSLRGGGILVMYATFSLKNIKLINNSALLGGGIYGEYINIINDINNINIIGNSAPYYGAGFLGATFNSGEIDHLIRITNAVIANNVANTPSETCNLGNTCGGLYVIIGMSQNFETRLQIVNTTFAGNKTKSTQGGGLCLDSVKDKRRIDIVNSIFYNNTISHGAPGMTEKPLQMFIRDSDLSKINLAYNDIQGLSSGIALSDSSYLSTQAENSMFIVGNIDVDPMFVNTNNIYSIDNNSPVEGKGIDNLIIKGKKIFSPLTDILNKVRPFPFNKMPDMGAYEVGVK